jgi:putative ABC transport system ATP-binding protein
MTSGQIVGDDDRVTLFREEISRVRADITSSASNEDFSQAPPSVTNVCPPLDPKCMALLEVCNATKLYASEGAPVIALQDVSFELDPGEIVAFVGRSGCGKSTLLNLCGAMDFPTSGEIILDGRVTSRLPDAELTRLRREKVGFVFQSFQLLHTLSVIENVELPLLLAQKRNARRAAFERLTWLEMDQYAGRLPHQLSGGQQQRVAIARALVHNPRLLVADEPTGNLDTATGELVLKLLVRAAREFGVAVIIATHSSEATSAADRVVRLRDGRMEEAVALR